MIVSEKFWERPFEPEFFFKKSFIMVRMIVSAVFILSHHQGMHFERSVFPLLREAKETTTTTTNNKEEEAEEDEKTTHVFFGRHGR